MVTISLQTHKIITQVMDINATWKLLCNKIVLHTESLTKHREFIKDYMYLSNDRLDLEKQKNFLVDKSSANDSANVSTMKEMESKISKLRDMQEKLYMEIKSHVRDCYQNTNYDYNDLEKLFRAHKLGIYLIADKIDKNKLIPGTDLLNKENEQVEYKVDFVVTNSNSYYLEQLGIECTPDTINDPTNKDIITETVKYNLENLSLCGDILVVDEEETQDAFGNMVMQSNDIEDMNSY